MVYIAKDENKDYLVHYGTKNMKWGVRKYQNEDGTLTEEGKKRYRDKLPSSAAEANINKSDIKTFERLAKSPTYSRQAKNISIKTSTGRIKPLWVDGFQSEKDARELYNMLHPNDPSMSDKALEEMVNKYGLNRMFELQAMAERTLDDANEKRKNQYKDSMPTSAKEAKKNEQIREKNAKNAAKYEGQIPTSARLGMQGKNVIQKVKAGKGSMPTSAITAQQRAKNESIVKSSIPASAWNSKTSYINRGPKAKASGLSTFMKKAINK